MLMPPTSPIRTGTESRGGIRPANLHSTAWRWWLAIGERLFGRPGATQGGLATLDAMPMPATTAAPVSVPIECLDHAVMITDASARVVAVNAAFSQITGFAADEVLQRNPRLLKSDRHGDAFFVDLWARLLRDDAWQGELWNRRKDGTLFPSWQSISVVRHPDGGIASYVSVFSDISALKVTETQLRHLAHHDPLTGLPNRLMFTSELERSMRRAQRQGQQLALLFIDLDEFKAVNDTLGHLAGDQLLRTIGARLRDAVRAEDAVARMGGDEFTLLLEEVGGHDAAVAAVRKLRDAIGQPVVLGQQVICVSASIGIALYPDDGHDAESLISAADAAMYRGKCRHGEERHQGGGPTVFATRP